MISKKPDVIAVSHIHVKALGSKIILDLEEMMFRIVTLIQSERMPLPLVLNNNNNKYSNNLLI